MKILKSVFPLLIFILFNSNSFSQDKNIFKKVQFNQEINPYIVQLMLEHLQESDISTSNGKRILLQLRSINENLKHLDKTNIIFLTTSETYRSILNYKFDVVLSNEAIMASQIIMVKNKLEKNKIIYTSFAKFIITNIVKDFEIYLEDNFLTKYQNKSTSDSRNYKRIAQLKKVVKYSGPWVNAISSTPPAAFNKLLINIIEYFFSNLEKQSKIFVLQSHNNSANPLTLFNGLNSDEVDNYLKRKDTNEDDQNQTTWKASSKREALDDIKELEIKHLENPSKDIDNLIKKIDQNKKNY